MGESNIGDILGFAGDIVAAQINASAQKKIAAKQIAALERQREFVFSNLDPEKLGPIAAAADIKNAKARLALQKELSPELFAARGEAEKNIRDQLKSLGVTSDKVADQAVKEALTGADVAAQGKQQLIDAALQQLSLGATLPPDVQAELVKAGLEKGGMVVGAASPRGIGGQLTRQLLGSAGIALQQQRQQAAVGLLGQAANLEQSRAQLLSTLFPNLVNTQVMRTQGTQQILGNINAQMAPVGMSGNDVLQLWLARVGSTTQIAQNQSQIAALGAQNSLAAQQKAWGAGSNFAANTLPASTSSYWNSKPAAVGQYSPASGYTGGGEVPASYDEAVAYGT